MHYSKEYERKNTDEMTKEKTGAIDLVHVIRTLESNTSNESVTEAFGVTQQFHNSIPKRRIAAACIEFEKKTETLAKFFKLAMEYCTTDEEYMYFIYYAIMYFALSDAIPPPLTGLMKLLKGLSDDPSDE